MWFLKSIIQFYFFFPCFCFSERVGLFVVFWVPVTTVRHVECYILWRQLYLSFTRQCFSGTCEMVLLLMWGHTVVYLSVFVCLLYTRFTYYKISLCWFLFNGNKGLFFGFNCFGLPNKYTWHWKNTVCANRCVCKCVWDSFFNALVLILRLEADGATCNLLCIQ